MRPALLVCALLAAACAGKKPAPPPPPAATTPEPQPDSLAQLDAIAKLTAAGDTDAARQQLDVLIQTAPALPLARLERAALLLDAGLEPALAVSDATHAAEALPDNPRAARLLGQALEETGKPLAAADAYRRSLALKDDPALRRRLAQVLARAGNPLEAVEVWERLSAETPDDVGARLALAELYEAVDRPASAEAQWTRVVELAETNFHLLRRFAGFLKRQGKLEDAREVDARADALDPPRDRELRPLLPSTR